MGSGGPPTLLSGRQTCDPRVSNLSPPNLVLRTRGYSSAGGDLTKLARPAAVSGLVAEFSRMRKNTARKTHASVLVPAVAEKVVVNAR